ALLGMGTLLAAWLVAHTVGRAVDRPLPRAMAFSVTAGLTSVSFSISFTWVEPLALLWLSAVLAAMAWSIGSRRPWAPIAVGAGASTAFLVHGRFLLVPLIWVAATIALAWPSLRRRDQGGPAVLVVTATTAVTGVGMVVARWLRERLIDDAWELPRLDMDARALNQIGEPGFPAALLTEIAGQLWYVTASTFGLAPMGLIALVATIAGRGPLTDERWRRTSAVVVAALLSVWMIGCLFMAGTIRSGAPRADHLIYGRYVDQVAVVLAAVGAAALVSCSRRWGARASVASAATMAALGAVAWWTRARTGASELPLLESTVSGLSSLPFDRPGWDVLRWTLVPLIGLTLIALARQIAPAAAAVTLCAILVMGSIAGAARARDAHLAWGNDELHAGYPSAPGGYASARVAADTLDRRAYLFNLPSQQYALADEGWSLDVVQEDSEELVRNLGDDTMVVVRDDLVQPPAGWCIRAKFHMVAVWMREAPRGPGCPT
ncbi:MAG: hypothetical protein ACK4V6_16565, partial [Microthrixaceae bacterium]